MLRRLAGIGTVLALVGTAHAQDRIAVSLVGKSPAALHADLYRAAEEVCSRTDGFTPEPSACVDATYAEALRKVRTADASRTASPLPAPGSR